MNLDGVSTAIRARLAGFTALSSAVQYIGYDKPQDDAPEDITAFPFCVIEDVTARRWDDKTSEGGNHLVQVTTFCRPTASKSAIQLAKETAQAAYDALHKFDLVVSGSNVIICLFEESPGLITDPDGVTRYQPMTFRVIYDGP